MSKVSHQRIERNGLAGERDGYSGDPGLTESRVPQESLLVVVASALVFLAGVWLVLAPYALDYQNTGTGFDGYWNDIVIGLALVVVAGIRMATPIRTAALSLVSVVLGAWLIIAPFMLDYNAGVDAVSATWNDIVVGIIVVVLAMTSGRLGARIPR